MFRELRYAIRQLANDRVFTCTAVAVHALGIAASVAIFGFVDAALIRPLPYREPARLYTVFGTRPEFAHEQTRGSVSYLNFVDWRARNAAFESIAAYDVRSGFTLMTSAGAERVSGLRVTSGFFRTLGVTPLLGREFQPSEEGRSAPATVMLSYSAWQTRFGGRADVIGATVTLQTPWLAGGGPHVVIGVLPPDFSFPLADDAEFWATIRGPQACWDVRTCQSLEAIARLRDGTSAETASANLTSILAQLQSEYPTTPSYTVVAKLVALRDAVLGNVRPILFLLLAGAGMLLVIACINVISLLLARSDRRAREFAVRNALGASSARLSLQFATEAIVLAGTSGVLGLILAAWGMWFLGSLLSADMISRMPYLRNASLNLHAAVFAAVVCLGGAIVFAVTPMARFRFTGMLQGLKDAGRGAATMTWRRFGANLVAAELAVAVLLVVNAGLLGKSLYRLLHLDTGFVAQRLMTVSVTPVAVRQTEASQARVPDHEPPALRAIRIADRVAALPGVQSVGYADLLPLSRGLAPASTFWVVGRASDRQVDDGGPVRRISAGYFETLQATLVRGRFFSRNEVAASRNVVIINDTAARRLFGGEDPVGRSIAFGGPNSPERQIVGVVADIADGPPDTPPHSAAYVPFDQSDLGLVIRTAQSDRSAFTVLAAAIHEIDPQAMVGRMSTMLDRLDESPSTSIRRSTAWLVGGFACIAFMLAVVGLYGVVAYSVGQRTREIGVRMALGARRAAVYRLILGEASRLIVGGALLGIVGALFTATLTNRLLFGVESWDPATFVGASMALIVAALVATYVPARRAASVDPIEILRDE
jgi:predicted permease